MRRFPKLQIILCGFTLFGLVACTGSDENTGKPREKRPVAGDTVTPVILLGKTWKQKGLVLISARLQVKGKKEAQPKLLQLEDIPHEIVPRVTLTFYNGKEQIKKVKDVDLKRDC